MHTIRKWSTRLIRVYWIQNDSHPLRQWEHLIKTKYGKESNRTDFPVSGRNEFAYCFWERRCFFDSWNVYGGTISPESQESFASWRGFTCTIYFSKWWSEGYFQRSRWGKNIIGRCWKSWTSILDELLNISLYRHRSRRRCVSIHHISITIYEKLGEVPFDSITEDPTLFSLEIYIEWMRVISVNEDFRK